MCASCCFLFVSLFSLMCKIRERREQKSGSRAPSSKKEVEVAFFFVSLSLSLFCFFDKASTFLSSSFFCKRRLLALASLSHARSLCSSYPLAERLPPTKKMAPVVALAQRSAVSARSTSVSTRAAAPSAVAAAAGSSPSQSIRIKLKSFDTRAIVEAGEAIIGAATSTGATVSGPVPLPTR